MVRRNTLPCRHRPSLPPYHQSVKPQQPSRPLVTVNVENSYYIPSRLPASLSSPAQYLWVEQPTVAAKMYPKMYPPPLTLREFATKEFDYLIVGGGTAGLVVASRLSEVTELEVGVIEAGEPAFDDPVLSRPGLYAMSLGSQYDWKFMSVPQPALAGRQIPFPRGKVLGGSSAMNFMAWTRGNQEDYDAWAELGNPGWGWDDLLSVDT